MRYVLAALGAAAAAAMSAKTDRFAGRYALGKNLGPVNAKAGMRFDREDVGGDVRVVGGASSEVLGGANLASLLRDGFEVERRAMAALEAGEPAEALSVHTSAGVPPQLARFLDAWEPHLPPAARAKGDWCVNLQAEGASAVHAAVDMALQVSQSSADLNRPGARNRVACGASSYHGPASTSPGGGTPLGAVAKGLTHPVRYPVPSPFLRRRGEEDEAFHARLFADFTTYLDTYADEIGVLLVEPQWGSSVAAMPWPAELLKAYCAEARSRGIPVVADEIMCGIGRHGQGACFLTECWDLDVDVVTFGKAIGGGAGNLLSGAILLEGAADFREASRTAFQSHTYAGSSARALANGANLLERLPELAGNVRDVHDAVGPIMADLADRSDGAVLAHGQGALWGGLFAHEDAAARTAANLAFKKKCAARSVLPYFVPVGGFMLTPRYDDEPELLAAAVADVAEAALETARDMGWAKARLLPSAYEGPPPSARRFQGPDPETMAPDQRVVYDEIRRTRTTGADRGPFGPWLASPPLADAAQNFGRVCRYETSLNQREAEIAILATAYAYKAPGLWTIHVGEARAAGLEGAHVAALARGARPAFAPGSREAAIHDATADLLASKRLGDDAYAAAEAALGATGLVELTSVVGYHGYVALTMNAFEVDDPLRPAGVNKRAPWTHDAASLSDAELADLVSMANKGELDLA